MVNRRNVLGFTGIALASAALPAFAAATALPNKVLLYARARGAPRGTRGMTWYTGTFWGKRSLDAAVALFKVNGFSFNRTEMQPDGGLVQDMIEVGFWCDPTTNQPVDKWINPMNGLPCTPKHYKTPQTVRFDATGHAPRPPQAPEGMRYDAWITDPVESGDVVWIGENIIVKSLTKPDSSAELTENRVPINTLTSLVTYTLRRKDIHTPASTFLPSTMNFQSLSTWYQWMRMGQELGQTMFQLTGRKVQSLQEVPPGLIRLIDERHPGWLKDPGI